MDESGVQAAPPPPFLLFLLLLSERHSGEYTIRRRYILEEVLTLFAVVFFRPNEPLPHFSYHSTSFTSLLVYFSCNIACIGTIHLYSVESLPLDLVVLVCFSQLTPVRCRLPPTSSKPVSSGRNHLNK
jgi:hypothetical protein